MCKAVVRRKAPGVRIFDLSHLIEPFGVLQGARVLAASVPWFPPAVHLAVVDPGVGTARRPVALSASDGSWLVGPDNGLLLPACRRLGGARRGFEITVEGVGAGTEPSSTFHGRDLFAPAAAHLALEEPPERLGPEVDVESLVELAVPEPSVVGECLRAAVLQVDRFGNLETNLRPSDLARIGVRRGGAAELATENGVHSAIYRRTYGEGPRGELQLVVDSHGSVAICVNQGNAARVLGAGAGAALEVAPADPG